MTPQTPVSQPTPARERIESIDALRGFAVLGILLMNIGAFALPESALGRPDSIANNTGPNFGFWVANELAVAGVFRALFSMLFGASVILLTARKADHGREQVADVYYRRTLWLIGFGVVHAYVLLGWIDILFVYGVAGLFLFPFRRMSARSLALIGLLVLAVPLPLVLRGVQAQRAEKAAVERVEARRAAGDTPDPEDLALADRWLSALQENAPTPEGHQEEIELRRSGYWANFRDSARRTIVEQSTNLYRRNFWDAAGMMFIGMALVKLGILSATHSNRRYAMLAVAGLAAGMAINANEVRIRLQHGFGPFSWAETQVTYDLGRLLMALGYVGAFMLVCRSGALRRVTQRLAAVGRMALTNYILQTVLCVLLFYGVGFGLFGAMERFELLYVVAGIWILQIVLSSVWLRHFRFGPLEWLWRSLTYLQWQSIRARPQRDESRQAQATGAGN